jgi:hypothetical protein
MTAIFPASTNGGGNCFGAPDVCLTPVPPPVSQAPIPYPNTGMLNQATKTSTKVKFSGKEAVTVQSEIPSSMGDEAGVKGGVVSGCNMGKVTFKTGSSKVKVEGQPCVHLTSLTAHNGANANMPCGLVVSPSQVKVIIAP